MRLPEYILDHDEVQNKWYIMDKKRKTLYGNLGGYNNDGEALNWIEADRLVPRRKCTQCKRVWKGALTECPICKETNIILKRLGGKLT